MQGSRTMWRLVAVMVLALPVGSARLLAYQDPEPASDESGDAASGGQDEETVAAEQDDAAEAAGDAGSDDQGESPDAEQGDGAEAAGDLGSDAEGESPVAEAEPEPAKAESTNAATGVAGDKGEGSADKPATGAKPDVAKAPAAPAAQPAKPGDGCDFARRETCLADCRVKHPQGEGAYGAWNPADKDKCDANCIYHDQPACAPKN